MTKQLTYQQPQEKIEDNTKQQPAVTNVIHQISQYNGLFFNTNTLNQESSGKISLTLNENNTYSAQINSEKTFGITGQLSPDGNTTNDNITINVNNHNIEGKINTEQGTAEIQGDKICNTPRTPTTWTLYITDNNQTTEGSFAVNTDNSAILTATLPTGERIQNYTTMSINHQWPVFQRLDNTKIALIGWLTESNNQISGNLTKLGSNNETLTVSSNIQH